METLFKTQLDPRAQSPSRFWEEALKFGVGRTNALRLLGAVMGRYDLDPKSWRDQGVITKRFAEKLLPLPALKMEQVTTSKIDGFQKILFKTEDSLSIETVIIPLLKENAVSICLSSQVGCVMGCTFCATARMPERRNLKTWEIVDQFLQARGLAESSGRRVTGAVFMGMGEPFLNYESVLSAAELLSFPVLKAIKSKAITISTVGLIPEIRRFTRERRPFRLSISLGAATDNKRKKLVPVAARAPIKEVMAAARDYAESRKDRVNLSYVCIADENIFNDDASALAELIGDTKVRLDLIEVTDSSGRYRRPNAEEFSRFRDQLNFCLRQPIVRRYSGGADINAACGTLAGAT